MHFVACYLYCHQSDCVCCYTVVSESFVMLYNNMKQVFYLLIGCFKPQRSCVVATSTAAI